MDGAPSLPWKCLPAVRLPILALLHPVTCSGLQANSTTCACPHTPCACQLCGHRRQQGLSVLLTEDSSAPSPGQAHSTRSTNFSSKTTWAFAEGMPAYLLSLSPCPHPTGVTPPMQQPQPLSWKSPYPQGSHNTAASVSVLNMKPILSPKRVCLPTTSRETRGRVPTFGPALQTQPMVSIL